MSRVQREPLCAAAFAIRRAVKAAGAHGTQAAYTLPEFVNNPLLKAEA